MNFNETWEQINLQLKSIERNKLEEFINHCKEHVFDENRDWFCPNHPLEVLFYTYFQKKELEELSEIGMHKMYYELARRKREEGSFIEARDYYIEAMKYNPVDLDILFNLATCYRELEEYEKVKEMAFELYFYCFTPMDIAWFYRLLGNYYLEKMKPQIAKNLYDYSNLFYETESANKEIDYLKKAMGKKLNEASILEIQENLTKESIPTKVNAKTLAFVYKVAMQAIEVGNLPYGKQLLIFLYEMTGDLKVKEELDKHSD